MSKKNKLSLTSKEIEEELKRENYKSRYAKVLKSTIYTLITVAAVATIIATLVMPVLEISGSSMSPTLTEGEIVLAFKDKSLEQGDIIAFYHGNRILVKRIIALSGDWVNIDDDGNVYVDGKLLDEPYAKEKMLGEADIEFPYQVPDSHYFVLGDNRGVSVDSRNSEISSVEQKDILGKVVISVWPLNKIGKIN